MPTLSRSEQEIPIARCAEEDPWTIYGADLAELPSSMSLADRVGGRVVRHQGGTKILLPQDSVFLQRRSKLHLTPEQRTERANQMQQRRTTTPVTHRPPA